MWGQVVRAGLGSLPFFKEDDSEPEPAAEEETKKPVIHPVSNRPAVLPDGSYATQTALADTFALPLATVNAAPNLRCGSLSTRVYIWLLCWC